MSNIQVIKNHNSNSLRSMLYKHATKGLTELQETAYRVLKKGLDNEESWAVKLYYDNINKIWDKKLMNSVDLSSIDFSKYKEAKDIPELCLILSQAALKNDDNSISLSDLKDMLSILTNLKIASTPENFAVDISDDKLLRINEIINEPDNLKIKIIKDVNN